MRCAELTRSLSVSMHLSKHPEAKAHWSQYPPCKKLSDL